MGWGAGWAGVSCWAGDFPRGPGQQAGQGVQAAPQAAAKPAGIPPLLPSRACMQKANPGGVCSSRAEGQACWGAGGWQGPPAGPGGRHPPGTASCGMLCAAPCRPRPCSALPTAAWTKPLMEGPTALADRRMSQPRMRPGLQGGCGGGAGAVEERREA